MLLDCPLELDLRLRLKIGRGRNYAMSQSMQNKVRGLLAQAGEKSRAQEIEVHRLRAIQDQARPYWDRLVKAIQDDVAFFINKFPGMLKSGSSDDELVVEKPGYPILKVDLAFTGTSVRCTYIEINEDAQVSKEDYTIGYVTDDAYNVYFRYGADRRTPEELGYILIEPLLPASL